MAQNVLGYNQEFPIYNANGTSFNGLVLKKSVVDSVVMSLGDKITGDVYYKDNGLVVTMQEYIEYKQNPDDPNEDGVKYTLVNPPTIVREGMVSENGQLNGMTKYSFVFYHPMYMLGNFPFSDIAVNEAQEKHLSQNKTFSWIGNLFDFKDKLNANLASTEWLVVIDIQQYEEDGVTETQQWKKANELSDVLSFDKQFVSDALKTGYDTWEIPFTITPTNQTVNGVAKKFLITFGLPSQEIYDDDGVTPFVFQFGQGVGLKNNSRTPRNNKIVTRLAGYGAERNVPFGYPQIVWEGNQSWEYTINNESGMQPIEIGGQTIMAMSYPIYDGIVGGQKVRLIKHPFTRKTLMPSVYADTVNKKVNPNATGYAPDTVIIDYYDAQNINPLAPSFETHQFEDIYPRLTNAQLVQVLPYDDRKYISQQEFFTYIVDKIANSLNYCEKEELNNLYANVTSYVVEAASANTGGSYTYSWKAQRYNYSAGYWYEARYTSSNVNFKLNVYLGDTSPAEDVYWDDTMDDEGKPKQPYFKMKLPQLSFDLYASAAVTEEMAINMKSGQCLGCSFGVYVDWDDYKNNFYKEEGGKSVFDPIIHTTEGDGHVRDGNKYPDSSQGQITVVVQKDNETFGTLMPNDYQQPRANDDFVILGISLPQSYVTAAEQELDSAMREYIEENNIYYYDYPLKFDEHFLATHQGILEQIQNNSVVRFQYAGSQMTLFVKQITIKYGENPLPQYDITLTDDVEIVLNKIGQVTDDVSRMRVQVSELQKYYSENLIQEINAKLSKVIDDVCQGRITFQQGLDSIGSAIFHDELRSPDFTSGLYTGRGWRVDQLGNAEFESVRARSFLEVVELLVNRMQAQEGDTIFTDNDQIDKVDKIVDPNDSSVTYILSLKEKYEGYYTSQMYGNILKGIINTLAAKQSGVSDVTTNSVYYTSWMRVVDTHNTDGNLGVNQIRVELYNDNETPAGKNFEPCELMTIARCGCEVYNANYSEKYQAEGLATETAARESIKRRQQVFYLSTSEGRIVKLNSVYKPKLEDGNYGTTLGELPEFVKQYSAVAPRLVDGGDYLYAQGIVVGDFIKVDKQGSPMVNYVDKGEWQDNTEYLVDEYNDVTMQYETHDVWHNGAYWRCLVTQPHNGVYYEPTEANNTYWKKLLTSGARGKVGRFFYFAGTFNQQDNDPTHVFEVNDAQAPYFEHTENGQKRYHVFNYDTNGTYTMSQMWAISSNWNNKPWEVMTNDFKYIMTEALFTDFALLGGFVVNGDYELSQYGYLLKFFAQGSYPEQGSGWEVYIDHDRSGFRIYKLSINSKEYIYDGQAAYTYFYDIEEDTENMDEPDYIQFMPRYCVNMATGKTKQGDGDFEGKITAKALSTDIFEIEYTDQVTSYYDPNGKWCASTVVVKIGYQATGHAVSVGFPNAGLYKGVKITFIAPHNDSRYNGLTFGEVRTMYGKEGIGCNFAASSHGAQLARFVIQSDGADWWLLDAVNITNTNGGSLNPFAY